MKINILTSLDAEFAESAKQLQRGLSRFGHKSKIYTDHTAIANGDILFILSYFKILTNVELSLHTNNIVIHASDLPFGRGFSPMSWQIAEGRNLVVFSLFEAAEEIDAGKIYFKRSLELNGAELYFEWKKLQNQMVIEMALDFVARLPDILKQGVAQDGVGNIYRRRNKTDDQLDISKSLSSQFDLLRICNPDRFPAWFTYRGRSFKIRIDPFDE